MKRKQSVQVAAAIAFLLIGCSHGSSPHDRLNGTWTSDIMTITIDFPAHKYSGVAMGEPFSHYLDLVSENANVVVFKESDATVTSQAHGSVAGPRHDKCRGPRHFHHVPERNMRSHKPC